MQIQQSLTQVYNRNKNMVGNSFQQASLKRISSRSSIRSIRSINSDSSRIKEDNVRMMKKI